MSPLYGGGRAEVECPGCGTTIRARMADQADSDLHEALAKAYFLDELGIAVSNPEALWAEQGADSRAYYYAAVNHSASIAQAYVDSQVAAARADERAKVLAVIEQEAELRQDGAMGGPVWTVTLSEVRAAFAAEADHG